MKLPVSFYRIWRDLTLVFPLAALATAFGASPQTIGDWSRWPALPAAKVEGVAPHLGNEGWLELRTTSATQLGEFVLTRPEGGWDLASFAEIAIPVRNLDSVPVRLALRVDDDQARKPPAVPLRLASRAEVAVPPGGEMCWLVAPLAGPPGDSPLAEKFISLVISPPEFVRRGSALGSRVAEVRVTFQDKRAGQRIAIGPIVARGTPTPLRHLPEERVFPLVDEFGQYVHRDWPGKIHAASDFAARWRDEERDLAAHARPRDWNRYGGWADGPQRAATGNFRVEKIDGVWWMIDPAGRLFWSHGVVRVGTRVRVGGVYRGTPLPEREHYFRLPAKDSPLGAFFGTEPQGTRGHYVGRHDHAVYDFIEANLFRKFGPQWNEAYAAHAQRRLASWGLNTIANSSDPAVFQRRETPYTAVVYSAPLGGTEFRLAGSTGNWGKLPDPFDPGWYQLMLTTLATEVKGATTDPWCIGFFVDNELHWGDTCHLAEATLASPAEQPAKRAFLTLLQQKYAAVAALNTAWGTQHATWEAFLAATVLPGRKRAAVTADLEAFSTHYLEKYFQGCREAVKAKAPHHMYLGCRFAGGANAAVMRVAVQHCDIVSINRYATLVHDLALPAGLDRPILIGEFHFGAYDRGPFSSALIPVADQNARAIAYRVYVDSALRNPRIVGTHWFQFYDQPTTGRFDGENYQTGLVDTCDTPYAETIAAVRQTAATLYPKRRATARP